MMTTRRLRRKLAMPILMPLQPWTLNPCTKPVCTPADHLLVRPALTPRCCAGRTAEGAEAAAAGSRGKRGRPSGARTASPGAQFALCIRAARGTPALSTCHAPELIWQ